MLLVAALASRVRPIAVFDDFSLHKCSSVYGLSNAVAGSVHTSKWKGSSAINAFSNAAV